MSVIAESLLPPPPLLLLLLLHTTPRFFSSVSTIVGGAADRVGAGGNGIDTDVVCEVHTFFVCASTETGKKKGETEAAGSGGGVGGGGDGGVASVGGGIKRGDNRFFLAERGVEENAGPAVGI